MGIFKPAWQSDKLAKALKAVDKTTALDKLVEIAERARHSDVQHAAIEKIDDQQVLANLIKRSHDRIVYNAAIERVSELALLVQIVEEAAVLDVQEAAVCRIDDQSALASIAKSHINPHVRALAVRRLTDQVWLRHVAEHAEALDTRLIAAERIHDQGVEEALCARIAVDASKLHDGQQSADSADLALRAIANISDEALLFELARSMVSGQIRDAVMAKMVDQRLMAEMVKADSISIDSLEQSPGWGVSASKTAAIVREAAYPRIAESVGRKVDELGPGLRIPANPVGNAHGARNTQYPMPPTEA